MWRWCSEHRRLRHVLVVYIRPDSSRVQSPSLSLSHPSRPLFVSSFVPVLYNSDLSPSPRAVVSISRTRYSLDRYASRLSLFCLSNTRSTAMWVRIGRPLCSCSRSRSRNTATIRYLTTAFALIAIIVPRLLSPSRHFRCAALNVSLLLSLKDLKVNSSFPLPLDFPYRDCVI